MPDDVIGTTVTSRAPPSTFLTILCHINYPSHKFMKHTPQARFELKENQNVNPIRAPRDFELHRDLTEGFECPGMAERRETERRETEALPRLPWSAGCSHTPMQKYL